MGKSAPKPDPRIGEAAVKSAEMGERYLSWMQGQSDITNQWAEDDRARFQGTFQPLEDRMVADALAADSPERRDAMASEAIADVRQQSALGRGQQQRQMSAMGVSPDSGRAKAETRRGNTAEALAAAGAGNMARRQAEGMGDAKMAAVVNMGRGMAVNPATSMGMSNQAAGAGFSGAMGGYQQQGNLLLGQHRAQMDSWNAQNQMMGGIGQGVGMLAGAFMSSEGSKTNKRKSMGVLDAVKDMRVEEWEYKQGMGDGGGRKHVGPYAEEFTAKTGLGDGREISVIDAVGVNMGATKELAAQVDKLQGKIDRMSGKSRGKVKEAA